MSGVELLFTIVTFIFFTALVGYVTYKIVGKSDNSDSVKGYFLAGNGLSGLFIAGSMILTNLSAENIVGLSGQGFNANMSGMAWETTAVVSTIITATLLLPIYLRRGYTTLPQMLEERFGIAVRRIVAVLFLIGYLVIGIPVALYAGAIAFNQIFNLSELLGVSTSFANNIVIVSVGIIGALYAIFGGLKAVAVSDSINGVLLTLACILVPVFGFMYLGDGNFVQGVDVLLTNTPEKLNAIGSSSDPVPFSTVFTGMIIANLFYWGTNQSIIQRSMGAKSLAEGQKGILYSGALKLLFPFLLIVPGIIAFNIDPNLTSGDYAYPTLVATVLPVPLLGLFCAALFGSIVSTYNSFLNSAATIYMIDIYSPLSKKKLSEHEIVKKAKIISVYFAIFAIGVSPFLNQIGDGLYTFARSFTGYYNIPVFTAVICAIVFSYANSKGIKAAVIFHMVFYSGFKMWFKMTNIDFLVKISEINYIHIYAISFVVMILIIFGFSYVERKKFVYKEVAIREDYDMNPWIYRKEFSIMSFSLLIFIYLIFSPLALAASDGVNSNFIVFISIILICILTILAISCSRKRKVNITQNINVVLEKE